MNTVTERSIHESTDDDLLERYAAMADGIRAAEAFKVKVEAELHQRMLARGATAIMGTHYTMEIGTKAEYDRQALAPLKEILAEADLAECHTPARQEEVQRPDAWDIRVVLRLAKAYGNEAMAIVDGARTMRNTGMQLKKREEIK